METRLTVEPYDYALAERLSAELGVSHVLAQVLVRRGHRATPRRARAFLAAADAHPLAAFGGLREGARPHPRARRAPLADHRARRLRRRRRGRHGRARARAAHARRRRRLVPAEPDRRRLRAGGRRPSSGSPRAGPTCWSPSTARSRRSRRSPPRAPRGSTSWSPTTTRPRADGALPDAPIVHPRLGGNPCPELCATGGRVQARAGAARGGRGGSRGRGRGPRPGGARHRGRRRAAGRREPAAGARRGCARSRARASPGCAR